MSYDPRKHGALCHLCPRNKEIPVPPEGKLTAKLVWLGQDPGRQEVRALRPFIGPTGTRLTHIYERSMTELGQEFDRAAVYITNAALCMPISKSDAEAKLAVTCCRPRLLAELKRLKSTVGFHVMGRWAWHSLNGLTHKLDKRLGFNGTVSLKKMALVSAAEIEKLQAKRKKALAKAALAGVSKRRVSPRISRRRVLPAAD